MTGVGTYHLARRQLQDTQPYRDEHFLRVMLTNTLINHTKHLSGRSVIMDRELIQEDLGDHHKQRRGNALTGYIGDHNAEMILIDQEEIIEIAADLFGGYHGSIDVKILTFGERGECIRQRIRLDRLRQGQLRTDTLLLRGRDRQVIDILQHIFLHLVDRGRQNRELFDIADIRAELFSWFILCRKALCLADDLVDRSDKLSANIYRGDQRGQDHQDCRRARNDIQEGSAGFDHALHHTLYTQYGNGLAFGILQRYQRRDMRRRSSQFIVTIDCAIGEAAVIQLTVGFLILVVGRIMRRP